LWQTLQALLNEAITQENLQDKVAIEAAMDGFVFEKLSTRSPTETFVSPTALEPGWSSAYIALLLWSILDLPPVPLKAKIWIGNHQLPLAHVIDRLDVFLDRVHSQGQVPHQEQYVSFYPPLTPSTGFCFCALDRQRTPSPKNNHRCASALPSLS